MDSIIPPTGKQTGYDFGAATTTYAKNCNKWVFGAEFFQRNYALRRRPPASGTIYC